MCSCELGESLLGGWCARDVPRCGWYPETLLGAAGQMTLMVTIVTSMRVLIGFNGPEQLHTVHPHFLPWLHHLHHLEKSRTKS